MENKPTQDNRPSTGPDLGKRILTVREREGLQDELRTRMGILKATEDTYSLGTNGATPVIPPGMAVNKQRLNQRAKEIQKVLDEHSPEAVAETLSPSDKDRLFKEAKAIKEELLNKQVLETRDELHVLRRDNPAWFSALKKAQMRPEYEDKINRYRNIMRVLEPQNEMADSLDALRKQRD